MTTVTINEFEKEIKIKLSLIIYIQICKHDVVHYCIFVNLTLNLILFQ